MSSPGLSLRHEARTVWPSCISTQGLAARGEGPSATRRMAGTSGEAAKKKRQLHGKGQVESTEKLKSSSAVAPYQSV